MVSREDILFVSKPLAPPWDDSGKVLPYLIAREIRGFRVRVPVPRGQVLDLPHVRCDEVFRRSWSWSVPFPDKARLLARLFRKDLPPIVHFFFSPNAPTTLAARAVRRRHPGIRVVQTVMSLPIRGAALEQGLFGDVVISPRTAVRNAREFKCTVVQEIALCVVHGILHLIGFNDRTAGERKVMEKEAFALLARVGYRYGNP